MHLLSDNWFFRFVAWNEILLFTLEQYTPSEEFFILLQVFLMMVNASQRLQLQI